MEMIVTLICKKDETAEVKSIIEGKKLEIIKSDETNPELNFYTFKPKEIGVTFLMAFEG